MLYTDIDIVILCYCIDTNYNVKMVAEENKKK